MNLQILGLVSKSCYDRRVGIENIYLKNYIPLSA
jgi:hypothetical protein